MHGLITQLIMTKMTNNQADNLHQLLEDLRTKMNSKIRQVELGESISIKHIKNWIVLIEKAISSLKSHHQ